MDFVSTARENADRPAVIIDGSGQTVTFGELERRSGAAARYFVDRGLQPDDVVALLTDARTEVFETYWATQRAGLYITAVNWHLTAEEAAYIVRDSGAKAFVASPALAELATAVAALVPDLEVRLAFGDGIPGFDSWEAAIEAGAEGLVEEIPGSIMLYSSGTTGFPKGVKSSRPDVTTGAVAMLGSRAYGAQAGDVYLSPAPIYHAAPLRWGGAFHLLGATVVLQPSFDAEGFLAGVERHRANLVQVVPTMMIRILKLDPEVRAKYDVSSLKAVIHAAAPCPPEVKRGFIDWLGPIVHEYYSATEANGMTMINSAQAETHPGSVGVPTIGVPHVLDPDTLEELPTGVDGLLYFERDALPFQYHNDPVKTAEAQHPEHPTWTTLGDIGHIDEDGFLYLTDRATFMIISGGVNIYPQEIENVLALHPVVYDVAVIGVPDAEFGEQVKAVVRLEAGVEGTEALAAELIDYVRERMARFKAPKTVDFVDELPRTATGKLVKRALRERYLTASGSTS